MKLTMLDRVGALALVGILIFVVVKRNVVDESKLESNFKFSNAVVYNIFIPVDGDPLAEFKYIVDSVVYKGQVSFNPFVKKILIGNKFLIKYYPPNPKISRIFLDKPL